MSVNREKQHRRSIRLASYDYRDAGAYFVTICAARKLPVFGRIESDAMQLNVYGRIVAEEWARTAELRVNVAIDEFVVMPNHFHAIVLVTHRIDTPVGAHCNAPLQRAPQSLASLVSGFKGAVTRRINAHRAERGLTPVVVWQRNYHERIIRDETELNHTRRYIIENPQNWETDTERL